MQEEVKAILRADEAILTICPPSVAFAPDDNGPGIAEVSDTAHSVYHLGGREKRRNTWKLPARFKDALIAPPLRKPRRREKEQEPPAPSSQQEEVGLTVPVPDDECTNAVNAPQFVHTEVNDHGICSLDPDVPMLKPYQPFQPVHLTAL